MIGSHSLSYLKMYLTPLFKAALDTVPLPSVTNQQASLFQWFSIIIRSNLTKGKQEYNAG